MNEHLHRLNSLKLNQATAEEQPGKGTGELSHVLISVLRASGSAEGTTTRGAIKQVRSGSDTDATAEPCLSLKKPLGEE